MNINALSSIASNSRQRFGSTAVVKRNAEPVKLPTADEAMKVLESLPKNHYAVRILGKNVHVNRMDTGFHIDFSVPGKGQTLFKKVHLPFTTPGVPIRATVQTNTDSGQKIIFGTPTEIPHQTGKGLRALSRLLRMLKQHQ